MLIVSGMNKVVNITEKNVAIMVWNDVESSSPRLPACLRFVNSRMATKAALIMIMNNSIPMTAGSNEEECEKSGGSSLRLNSRGIVGGLTSGDKDFISMIL